jgi:hypothetical protein
MTGRHRFFTCIFNTLPANIDSAVIRSMVDRFCRGRRGPLLLLVAAPLLLYLPGIVSIPPTDRDEARYTQASKQMVPLVRVASVSGINYSKGQFVNQGLYLHPGSDYENRK